MARRKHRKRRKNRRREQRSFQNPAVPLTGSTILSYLGGGAKSNSGVNVTWRSALTVSPVWQAVDLITSDVSRIHFNVYRTLSNGGKELATTHPVYRLLRRHTGEVTSNIWIIRMLGHALLYGNAYSRIVFDGPRVRKLEWLHRDQVEVDFEAGRKLYLVHYDINLNGRSDIARVPEDNMFHLSGLTMDAFGGLSLIDFARNTIGREMASERYYDDFMRNNAVPSGMFNHPGEMSEPAQKRFIDAYQRQHSGSNRFLPMILEEGMKWESIGINPRDASLIEQIKMGIKDVSRFFNVPAYKLGDAEKIAYNTLEEENRSYFDSSLGKWVSRFENEANYKLFLDESESQFFSEFNVDLWDKVSTDTRYKVHAIALQNGIKTPNEVRIEENLQPVEGGDELAQPKTQADNSNPPSGGRPNDLDIPDGSEDDEPKDDERTIDREGLARRDLLSERLADATRLLGNAAKRAAKKPDDFLGHVNDMRSRFGEQVRGKIAAAAAASGQDADALADVIFTRCADQLLSASECSREQLVSRVGDTVDAWPEFCRNLATDIIFDEVQLCNQSNAA